MKNKVSINDLKLGMYVVELDRPWESVPFESPFDLQGFTITTVDEIVRLQELCRYVYIDPELGVGAARYLSEEHNLTELGGLVKKTADALPLQDFYPEQVTVEEELNRAQEILEDSRAVYDKVIQDIQAGNVTDTKAVKNVVNSLVESVLRNPAATAWLVRLKHRDAASYSHAISVCVMALTLGRFLGLPKKDLETLGVAALLQDLGKVKLPQELLSKVGELNRKEREALKTHVDISVLLVNSMEDVSNKVANIVASHHERFDGSGYPRKFSRSQIDTLAAIAGLVDSYEAMTSERPYRKAKTSFQALMELYEERDKTFPGGLVEQFIQCIGIFPVGSFVELNSGEIGVVVSRNRVQQLKPRVMILVDPSGEKMSQPQAIDLAAQYLVPAKTPRIITKIVEPEQYDLDASQFFF